MPRLVTIDRTGLAVPSKAREQAKRAIRATVRAIAWDIKRYIMADMRAPKHGRAYRRPNGRIHIASAPGESPAVDTGRLIRSLDVIERRTADGADAFVGTDVPYAAYLEEGTKDGRLAPRPFAEPAANAHRDAFVEQLRTNITLALNGNYDNIVAVAPWPT